MTTSGDPPPTDPPDEQAQRPEWRPDDPATWEAVADAARSQARERGKDVVRIRRTAHRSPAVTTGMVTGGSRAGSPREPTRRDGSPPEATRRDGAGRSIPSHRRRHRRRVLVLALVAFGALGVAGAILADAYIQAYRVYKDTRAILPSLEKARASLARGQIPASDPFDQASSVASRARQDVDGARFTFKLVGAIPYLGRPVQAVRLGVTAAQEEAAAATILRDMVKEVLGESALSGSEPSASPGGRGVPVFHDGTVDVDILSGLAPKLEEVIAHLHAGEAAVRAIPSVPFVETLDSLKATALQESARAGTLAERALAAVKLLPSFLGADGTRTYFLAMQQNAALRGTGGSVLAYAFVKISNGAISLDGAGSINDIDDRREGAPAKFSPAVSWYLDATGVVPRISNGVDYTPNFPAVARAWQAQMPPATGQRIDGVIALDPVAMSYVLRGGKPIDVRSYPQPITARNVVFVTENDQFRLPAFQQHALPVELIAVAFQRLVHPRDLVGTLQQLSLALAEKHVQVWAADDDNGAFLHSLGWDGSLRSEPGDYLDLAQNNRYSNKIDYYGHQDITYTARVSQDGHIDSTYTVAVSNRIPEGQPRGIAGPPQIEGLNRAMMTLYVPKKARFRSVSPASPAAGAPPKRFREHTEGAFRAFTQTILAGPGQTASLTFRYAVRGVIQPTEAGNLYRLTIQHQPLVNPATIMVKVILPEGASVKSAPGWTVDGNVATYKVKLTRDLVISLVY
jgi:uncharacterized protein DUF4012